jgi:hypothetical protein
MACCRGNVADLQWALHVLTNCKVPCLVLCCCEQTLLEARPMALSGGQEPWAHNLQLLGAFCIILAWRLSTMHNSIWARPWCTCGWVGWYRSRSEGW